MPEKTFNVAVAGATGAVGNQMITCLEERNFPLKSIKFLASSRSVGRKIRFRGDMIPVEELTGDVFKGVDIAIFSAGGGPSKTFAPQAVEAGCVVVDNSSAWRMDPEVPLVVPEVNPEAIAGFRTKGIIANPNCSTIQMVVALKPLHAAFGIRRVVVSTYQSTSGGGKSAMDELFNQTRGIFMNQPWRDHQAKFTKQIAFNAIPHIDVFMDDGATKEEWKMNVETRKILDPKIKVHANCARIPSFIGHAEYINIETEKPIDAESARTVLRAAEGVTVVDHRQDEGYVTPAECAGEDPVYVSRIRDDATVDNGLSFWCVSDNLRKGAALNTVQIAEVLCRDYLDA